MIDYSFKTNKADYILSITAMLQPVLTLLQLFLMDALHMDADVANRIRVLTTAIPIIISMVIVLRRNLMLTLSTYSIVLIILLLTVVMYPDRWQYMRNDVLKFTLPVILPVGLCIASIRNFAVFAKSMMFISVCASIIGLLYAVMYVLGAFIIESYSMTFSYALLFPTFILITKKSKIWKSVAILLMIEMLAIGSRGALLLSILYWLFLLIWKKMSVAKLVSYGLLITASYFLFFESLINALISFFASVGIKSRTLNLLVNDELVSHDSGRDYLYERTWDLIYQNPLFGNGVWADRQYFDIYCHNVLLELILDFGFIGAGLILLYFFIKQIGIFKKLPTNHKLMYIMMVGILCPLFVSTSYLISFNVGMFLGFSYLQSKMYDLQLYQDYEFK